MSLFSHLDDLPVELAPDGLPKDPGAWLESLPISTAIESLVDYPSSNGEGDGVAVNTRVPTAWISQIDQIRQLPGTNLPNIWPTRAAFARWCIMEGMKSLVKIAEIINDPENRPDLDPILNARIFVEQVGGSISARTQTMKETGEHISGVAREINKLIAMDEIHEAVSLLNTWLSGADDQPSEFWRSYFIKSMIQDPDMVIAVSLLIRSGALDHPQLATMAEEAGVLDVGYDPHAEMRKRKQERERNKKDPQPQETHDD